MPLIIHSESSCDVCLDTLTYDDSAPPYAIPCGHIFCRACLHHMYPHNCPLCREPYSLERAKKLITGEGPAVNDRRVVDERPAVNDRSEDDDLLRRLIASWDMQEEQLVALLSEVDGWLQSRPEDASLPLRKARELLNSYDTLVTKSEDDQRTIDRLEISLERHESVASVYRFTAVAVEESLLTQMEELNMKLAQYESETEMLREEILALKREKELPLPPSSEPSPLEGLLPFARHAGLGLSTHRYTSAGSSSTPSRINRNVYVSPDSAPPSPIASPGPELKLRIPSNSNDRKGTQRDWWDFHRALYESPVDSRSARPLGFSDDGEQTRRPDLYTPTARTLQLIGNFPLYT